jgi:hypothetical protein
MIRWQIAKKYVWKLKKILHFKLKKFTSI